jgi:hypothetical protein
MVGFPYDDLNAWRAIYPPEVFVQQFEKVADGFDGALAELKSASARIESATREQRRAREDECRVAAAAAIHFRSSANQARFVMARRAVAEAKNPETAATQRKEMERVLRSEIALAQRLHEIQSRDSRIGFEASNQYYYVPVDLMEKVLNCRDLLARSSKS